MGLDIVAYKNLNKIEDPSTKAEDDSFVNDLHDNTEFPGMMEPFRSDETYVTRCEPFVFYAGSYSFYFEWRNKLCQLALKCHLLQIGENPEEYKGKPFFELLYFSDTEGTIGCIAAKKLLKDFIDYQSLADSLNDKVFSEVYSDFKKAFEIASEDGIVDFC